MPQPPDTIDLLPYALTFVWPTKEYWTDEAIDGLVGQKFKSDQTISGVIQAARRVYANENPDNALFITLKVDKASFNVTYEKPWPGFCQHCGAKLTPRDATYCNACGSSDEDEN
jgi:hypothetical protein